MANSPQVLTITGNNGYFTIDSSATQSRHFPKNGLILRRDGDKFWFENGGDDIRELSRMVYGIDTITIDTVAPASADAMETALEAVLFQ